MVPLRTRLADAVRENRNIRTEHPYRFRVEGQGKWIHCIAQTVRAVGRDIGEEEREQSIQKPWAYGGLFVLC